MERTFVTGATGYVGRRLVRAMAAAGAGVVVLVRKGATIPAGTSWPGSWS